MDAQRLDLEEPSTLPGMPSIRGLLRSVQVPEFPGLTFHEVREERAEPRARRIRDALPVDHQPVTRVARIRASTAWR